MIGRSTDPFFCVSCYELQKERHEYEVVVESGKLVYKKNGAFVQTLGDSKWIFVLSTTKALYVGQVNINFS
jgi:5-deoxy-D-glucuronate isomerase